MPEMHTDYPGEKVYRDMRGHEMVVSPHFSTFEGKWFYVYALASHSGECDCDTWDVDDWGDLD